MSSRRKQRVDDNDDGPGGTAVDTTPPNRKKSRQSATKTAGNIVGGPVSSSSSSSSSTKTVLDKIMYAIRNQPATAKGVSRTAISKYIKSELSFDNEAALKRAIKKGVDDGKLIQTGQSFWIAGDPDPSNKQQQQQSTALKIEDMQVGEGEAAKAGDTVIVEYEGSLQDGTVFDSADTFEFCLGIGEVIKGWDQGVTGMKVGGTRNLFVPSAMGYGKRGSPPEIPPNADLSFVVTLKGIRT